MTAAWRSPAPTTAGASTRTAAGPVPPRRYRWAGPGDDDQPGHLRLPGAPCPERAGTALLQLPHLAVAGRSGSPARAAAAAPPAGQLPVPRSPRPTRVAH